MSWGLMQDTKKLNLQKNGFSGSFRQDSNTSSQSQHPFMQPAGKNDV